MINGTASHAVPKRQQALLRNTIPTGCEIRARRNCSGVTIGYEPLRIAVSTQLARPHPHLRSTDTVG